MWTWGFAKTTLSPVAVQKFTPLSGEPIGLVEQFRSSLLQRPTGLSDLRRTVRVKCQYCL